MKKRIAALGMAIVMVLGITAAAVGGKKTITVSPMTMTVNGTAVTPTKSDGTPAEVFSYDGATYVPLRYLSELLGIGVEWDKDAPDVAKLKSDKLSVGGGIADGTYTGTGLGFGGDVTASIIVSGGKITDVTLTGTNETPAIGGAALDKLAEQVKTAGSADIDGVSGATMTTNGVKTAVEAALNAAKGVAPSTEISYIPGTYEGTASGMGGEIKVAVTVTGDTITEVKVVSQNETELIGCGLPTAPVETFPGLIVENQSLALDTVTGATVTSKGLLAAVTDALTKAKANITALQAKKVPARVQKTETITCDVVIAGAGGAGIAAAIQAASNGADVVVVEKAGVMTGSSVRNGGQFMAASQKYTDVENDELFDYIYDYIGHKNVDPVRIRNYVDDSGAMLEYLISIGVPVDLVEYIWDGVVDLPVVYLANSVNEDNDIKLVRGFYTSSGSLYMTKLYDEAVKAGAKIYFDTPMTEITSENGKVTGIVCQREDGSVLTVKAGATILACGGYEGNEELLAENMMLIPGNYDNIGGITNTGDGMLLAKELGAAVRYETDITPGAPATSALGYYGTALKVTPAGERFTREYDYFFSYHADLRDKGYGYFYDIIDESFTGGTFDDGIAAARAGGDPNIVMGDTVEELAGKLNMDAAVLRATIERYNKLCAQGKDTDFEKDSEYMVPICADGSKKLIAFKSSCTVCNTYGGIKTDAGSRVLTADGKAIDGLYAAGNAAFADWLYYEYPGCGYCFGVVLYSGKTAALSALQDAGVENVTDVMVKR